jgi:ABC-type uncharacterized transport system permease subunit
LSEIDIEYAHLARQVGIERFERAPAFNGDPDFQDVLADIVVEHLRSGEACSRQYGLRCPGCENPQCRNILNPVAPYRPDATEGVGMATTLAVLNGLLPVGYLIALLGYLAVFVRQQAPYGPWVTGFARGVVALHGVYLVMSGIEYEHVPLATTWESLTFTAFAVALVYLILEWQMRDRSTGLFLMAGVLLLQMLSTAFISHTGEVPDILRSPMFGIHVSTAVLGYVALAVSALYGLIYLIQYRQLKERHVGLLFQRLPNLETLSRMNVRAWPSGGWGLPWRSWRGPSGPTT